MVWPLDIQRLYYVGPGATQTIDSMFISDARDNKSAEAQMKMLWDEIQMRPDAKGIGSLFAKNGGKWNHHSVQFLLCEYRKVCSPAARFDRRNYPKPHDKRKRYLRAAGQFYKSLGQE